MVIVTITADLNSITDKLNPKQIDETKRLGLEYASQEMIRVLMRNSPVDHGLLKMWHISEQSDSEIHIRSPARYAEWVNDGTQPHWIEPKTAKALHWGGKEGPFSKGHYVGGITGRHFVEDSISDVEGRLDGYFLKALSEVIG